MNTFINLHHTINQRRVRRNVARRRQHDVTPGKPRLDSLVEGRPKTTLCLPLVKLLLFVKQQNKKGQATKSHLRRLSATRPSIVEWARTAHEYVIRVYPWGIRGFAPFTRVKFAISVSSEILAYFSVCQRIFKPLIDTILNSIMQGKIAFFSCFL